MYKKRDRIILKEIIPFYPVPVSYTHLELCCLKENVTLEEGIGDTIRVSLTEAPEQEIPVARTLIGLCRQMYQPGRLYAMGRSTKPVIVADISASEVVDEKAIRQLDFYENKEIDPALGVRLEAGAKSCLLYTSSLQ